jgi:hypothetical protein
MKSRALADAQSKILFYTLVVAAMLLCSSAPAAAGASPPLTTYCGALPLLSVQTTGNAAIPFGTAYVAGIAVSVAYSYVLGSGPNRCTLDVIPEQPVRACAVTITKGNNAELYGKNAAVVGVYLYNPCTQGITVTFELIYTSCNNDACQTPQIVNYVDYLVQPMAAGI